MVDINEETIRTLTELSRIGCTKEEESSLLRDMRAILRYAEQLQELDTTGVIPCYQVHTDMVNVMREDAPNNTLPRQKLLDNAPESIGGFIRVPPVQKKPS